MNDNDLIELFLPIITDGLTANGYSGVTVQQNYEPTMQGINSGPTVYFFKVGDHRYGFTKREDVLPSPDSPIFTHTETQQYETTFQVSALVTEDVNNISYTASDLVNIVAAILGSDNARNIMQDQNVEILRITEVRNPYFIDDRDRYEADPSFDFTLTYLRAIIATTPIVTQPIQADVVPI